MTPDIRHVERFEHFLKVSALWLSCFWRNYVLMVWKKRVTQLINQLGKGLKKTANYLLLGVLEGDKATEGGKGSP